MFGCIIGIVAQSPCRNQEASFGRGAFQFYRSGLGRQRRLAEGLSMVDKVNLLEKFGRFNEQWSPKIAAELNDSYVKLAKLQGEFVWHHHEMEDELFLVVKGRLVIRLRDGEIALEEGELVVIPRGVEHQPFAEEEAWVVLLEPKTTRNTGNVTNERTVEENDWIA